MDPFDNLFWICMQGSQAALATGTERVRRFLPGFSPIAAFADPRRPDLDGLRALFDPGETFFAPEWSGPVPPHWTVHLDTSMLAMVWDGRAAPPADPTLGERRLTTEDVPQMCDLAARTRPGPFGPRTIEFGDYVGAFDDDRLIAMAGERLQHGALREVSGICTEPEYQGRGLARRLTAVVVRQQLEKGETPFLHVASTNARAIALYERMGFVTAREIAVRIMSRSA